MGLWGWRWVGGMLSEPDADINVVDVDESLRRGVLPGKRTITQKQEDAAHSRAELTRLRKGHQQELEYQENLMEKLTKQLRETSKLKEKLEFDQKKVTSDMNEAEKKEVKDRVQSLPGTAQKVMKTGAKISELKEKLAELQSYLFNLIDVKNVSVKFERHKILVGDDGEKGRRGSSKTLSSLKGSSNIVLPAASFTSTNSRNKENE